MSGALLEIRGLRKRFVVKGGMFRRTTTVDAVRGFDLTVRRGKVVGLAGESGSGKSTVARLVARIIEPDEGVVSFDGRDLGRLKGKQLRTVRSLMPMVFQDPYASLDPTKMILDIVAEPVRVHRRDLKTEVEDLVIKQLERVGLEPSHRHRYPYEFSGGQRQRIAIARALISEPRLVIADEPVSALDVSTQAQILNLLDDLRREHDLGMLFISHDLAVLRHISDEIAVMFKGRIVERGAVDLIFEKPTHPYTIELLNAVPRITGRRLEPSPRTFPTGEGTTRIENFSPEMGCVYQGRCPHAMEICATHEPMLTDQFMGTSVACHLVASPARNAHERVLIEKGNEL